MSNPLLEAAITEYQIPAWPYEASYDRIVVYSLPEKKAQRETYVEGGAIVMPETVQAREKSQTPRGIIVSAGLGARDVLKSHGMGLGHVVWVARLSPWRHEVERTKDGTIEFLFLRAGDVVGSETLQQWIADGKVSVTYDEADGRHAYRYEDGTIAPRFDPPDFVA